MKKSRVYTRKRLALHWILLALVFLLVVNQLLGVCLLLPIQAAHRSADLQGIGRAHLVERRWEPEWRATGLLYLMGNENAIFITDTHLGPLGWETERGAAVDCTGDAPLYVGQYDAAYEDRMVNCLFGRVDDPDIQRLEFEIRSGSDLANISYATSFREDWITKGEYTYFLVRQEFEGVWGRLELQRTIAYDDAGRIVTTVAGGT